MKKKLLATCLLALALCLSACGKTNDEKIVDDFTQINDVGVSSNENEEVNEFAPNMLNDLKFDVSISMEGTSNAVVYNATIIDINDDYLINFANSIFDRDTVHICKPFQICSQSELEDELAMLDDINANAEETKHVPLDYYYHIKNILDTYDPGNEHSLEKDYCIAEYNTEYGNAFAGLIKGKIDGADYALIYSDMNIDTNLDNASSTIIDELTSSPIRLQRITPAFTYQTTQNKNYTDADLIYGENLISESTARAQAEQFLADLGFNDFSFEEYGQRACSIDDNTYCYDGYSYIFTRQISGIKCPIFSCTDIIDMSPIISAKNAENVVGIQRPSVVAHEEYIRVDVDSEGIALVDFNNLYEVGEILSSNVNILSYNQAVDIANQMIYFRDMLPDTSDPIKINARFSYIPFKYDDKNVFIPAWLFYISKEDMSSDIYEHSTLYNALYCDNLLAAVSALDGSMISYSGEDIYSSVFKEQHYDK